jgi:hypothetical protein
MRLVIQLPLTFNLFFGKMTKGDTGLEGRLSVVVLKEGLVDYFDPTGGKTLRQRVKRAAIRGCRHTTTFRRVNRFQRRAFVLDARNIVFDTQRRRFRQFLIIMSDTSLLIKPFIGFFTFKNNCLYSIIIDMRWNINRN